MSNFYGATSLIGGGNGALDKIDGAALADGDAALVITPQGTMAFSLSETSGAAESVPNVVAPDTNAGTKRWLYVNACAGEIWLENNVTSIQTVIPAADTQVQITVFDANKAAFSTVPDYTQAHIEILRPGWYDIQCSATINHGDGPSTSTKFKMAVMKNNGASNILAPMDRNLPASALAAGVVSLSGLADLDVGDTVEVWIQNLTNERNYVIESITLCLILEIPEL